MKAILARYRPKREHFFRLLGALVLALVVWVYVTNTRNPETQVPFENVTVEVQNLPAGFILTDAEGIPLPALEKASVVVWAPEAEHVGLPDISVYVDLSGIAEDGTYELPVQAKIARAARTWSITPQRITVRVEPLRQELFPVLVILLGQPGLPYIVGAPQIDPSRAVVQGPASRLDLVDRVEAQADLAGRAISLENAPVAILAVDEGGNAVAGVTVSPARAALSVPISLQGGHTRVAVVPTTTGQLAAGYYVRQIEVNPDMVTIFSGEPAVLATLHYMDTAPVDLSGRRADFSQTVALDLPPNVALVNSPAQVTVTVHLGTIVPELRLAIPVFVDGLAEGLQAAWMPQWLDVQVTGPLDSLEGLSLNDLRAVANLAGLDVGEYDLVLAFPAPAGVVVTPTYTDTVHVVIVRPATPTPFPTPTGTPSPTPAVTPTVTPPAAPPTPTVTPGLSPTPTRMPSPTPTP